LSGAAAFFGRGGAAEGRKCPFGGGGLCLGWEELR
jgi:hypothetical protein